MNNPIETKSGLHFYSIGIVATNKELTEHFVEILPVEYNTFLKGEILDHFEEYETKGKDYHGKSFDIKAETTVTIRAKWLPLGQTNRITPPDIRRGEQVLVYRFSDTDEYYWVDMMQYKHIRRLETVIWSFSNNRKENVEDTPDSTYWVEMSTHKKVIHIHTSMSDEEPFEYDIQINTKDGRVVIQDNELNYLFLDSAERHWRMHNKDSSYIEMDKRVINIHSLDEVNITTKDFTLVAKESITTKTKEYEEKTEKYTMEATESHKLETKKQEISNEEFTLYTEKDYRHNIKGGVYFETPRWEYKVGSMKFKIKNKLHAHIDPGTDIEDPQGIGKEPPVLQFVFTGGPIMNDVYVSTPIVMATPTAYSPVIIPPLEIKLEDVEKPEIEVEDPTPLEPVH